MGLRPQIRPDNEVTSYKRKEKSVTVHQAVNSHILYMCTVAEHCRDVYFLHRSTPTTYDSYYACSRCISSCTVILCTCLQEISATCTCILNTSRTDAYAPYNVQSGTFESTSMFNAIHFMDTILYLRSCECYAIVGIQLYWCTYLLQKPPQQVLKSMRELRVGF